MYKCKEPLILASGSARRSELLKQLGLSFEVVAVQIDETPRPQESANDFVSRMAVSKNNEVAVNNPQSWVISGDTIVCNGSKIFGKPLSEDDAVKTLMQLSGKMHEVKTSFCVARLQDEVTIVRTVTTEVLFTNFTRDTARAYVTTRESMDKAGAYGIQGIGGVLVKSINGSYSNVVGLPLAELIKVLTTIGAIREAA